MPAAFIGHGSPMNALEDNRYTQAWAGFARRVGQPRAILAISAHWFVGYTAVTAMAQPPTLHDFGGFPRALSQMAYPAPGDPALARRVAELLGPTEVKLDTDSWGLDHGTWSVLAPMYPAANIPVVQLSINAKLSFEEHMQLGARLAPLRQEGVLILGSGNVVHNLGHMRPDVGGAHFPWAQAFDDAAQALMTQRPQDLPQLLNHPGYRQAVPTPEHLFPLLYIAGLATVAQRVPEVITTGISMESISMTSYGLMA